MERRRFLRWAVHGLGAVFASVLAFPAIVYLIDPRNRPRRERGFQPVGRLKELRIDVPTEAVIRETTQDAWTLHPDDVVGRVWLVRRPNRDGHPLVEAYNTTCPHLGCSINYSSAAGQFLCPCHGARFHLDGSRVEARPAPRAMDSLPTRLEQIPGTPDNDPDYLVLVEYKKYKTNLATREEI